jgi:MbtH protein
MKYKVVINHEEQYAIFPASQKIPPGWVDSGFSGTKDECLEYIGQNWLDMRPKKIRQVS